MIPISETLISKLKNENRVEVANISNLPQTYNETKVVILPKDPMWIYAYWEISEDTFEKIANRYGTDFDSSSIVIRVCDITDINFNDKNARRYFDTKVQPCALSWYVNVEEYNRSWCVDIGHVLKNVLYKVS